MPLKRGEAICQIVSQTVGNVDPHGTFTTHREVRHHEWQLQSSRIPPNCTGAGMRNSEGPSWRYSPYRIGRRTRGSTSDWSGSPACRPAISIRCSVALAAPPCSRTRLLVSDLAKGIQTLADRWGVVPATPRRRLIRAGLRSHGILDASTRYRTLRCPDRFAGWLAGQKSQSSTLRQFLAEGLDALPPGHTSQVPSRRQAHHFQGGGCSGSERPVHRGFPLA